MSWSELTLGDVISIKHGFAFKGEHFTNSGKYILLTPGNCYERGGLRLKGDKEKYYSGDLSDDYIFKSNDLVVVMTDLVNTAPILGGAFLVPEDDKYLHNQRLGLVAIKDEGKYDKRFIFYVLNSQYYRAQIRGSASGATVRHTAPGRIYNCKVLIPSFDEQKRISSTLAAYDELIANNKRRIELLEQSARALFKEWFVQLRYPGHEHDSISDGVPQGWQRMKLRDILTLNYGKALQAEKRNGGCVPVYGSSGHVGDHDEALVEGPGIVVGRKGNVGSIEWVDIPFWPIDTAYFVKPEDVSLFILHLLKVQKYNNSDAAVPGLNRDAAYGIDILWPPANLRREYEEFAQPLYAQRHTLLASAEKLTRARDLLLPRLMDGRLSI